VVSGARPNLNTKEAQVLEEFIAEFQDIFATKSGDYGLTNKVYHCIDTGDAHPIFSPHADFPYPSEGEQHARRHEKTWSDRRVGKPRSSPVVIVRKKEGDDVQSCLLGYTAV
jgi:hypothetical protein